MCTCYNDSVKECVDIFDVPAHFEERTRGIMPTSEAQKRATMKYMKNNYDRIELKVTIGRKTELKAHAASREESLNGFVNRAINEAVERDTGANRDNA